MFYEIVDTISHRDNPFDKIQWYVILSKNNEYFFNNIETTEYEPITSYSLEKGDVVPLQVFHIDILIDVYQISGSKMDEHHYNKIMSIKKQLVRNSKINELL